MNIGSNIQRIRLEKCLTQERLGEELGISQSAVGQFEAEDSDPKVSTLMKIAEALEVPVSELFSGEKMDLKEEDDIERMMESIAELIKNPKISKAPQTNLPALMELEVMLMLFQEFQQMWNSLKLLIEAILKEQSRSDSFDDHSGGKTKIFKAPHFLKDEDAKHRAYAPLQVTIKMHSVDDVMETVDKLQELRAAYPFTEIHLEVNLG